SDGLPGPVGKFGSAQALGVAVDQEELYGCAGHGLGLSNYYWGLQIGPPEEPVAVDGVAGGSDLPLAVPIPHRAPRRTEESRGLLAVWPLGAGHGHGRASRTAASLEGQGRPHWIPPPRGGGGPAPKP